MRRLQQNDASSGLSDNDARARQQRLGVQVLGGKLRKAQSTRNAAVLAVCHGMYTCAISIDLTLTALAGYALAPNKMLTTLPFALITVVGALATIFASLLMQRFGRRVGFVLGALVGACGGAISVWAVSQKSFWGFCVGTGAVGVFQAFAQYYRLAAADSVPPTKRAEAISTVLTGGVIAAVLGPPLAAWSRDLLTSVAFAGSYMMVALLGVISALVLLAFYQDDYQCAAEVNHGSPAAPRPLRAIMAQPVFVASVANNVIGSVVMMFIMTAAPLAAVSCHHSIDEGASIIQWHLIGMFAPSFIVAHLMKRFGVSPIVFVGIALNALCAVIAMKSTGLIAFYIALLCLGVGWNFMFVGGTTLLTQSYLPTERGKTQGISEFLRYAATAVATLVAGPLVEHCGWSRINDGILPVLGICTIATAWWALSCRVKR